MKKCNYCLEEKDLIEFPKKGAKCKECTSNHKKRYITKGNRWSD